MRAKRGAREHLSPFACLSRVYFSRYHPNRELSRRLNSNVYATPNIPALSEQFEFQPVSENDVANVILTLPSNKAPGFDKISARILKDSYQLLCI